LAELQPHYGLHLKLVESEALGLSEREKKLLDDGLLVVRGDFKEFLSRIDSGMQLLEIKLPEEPKWMYMWVYGFLGLCLAIVLYFWVRPHWRDLEHIRLAPSASAITTSAHASCCRVAPPCANWPGTSTRWPNASRA